MLILFNRWLFLVAAGEEEGSGSEDAELVGVGGRLPSFRRRLRSSDFRRRTVLATMLFVTVKFLVSAYSVIKII